MREIGPWQPVTDPGECFYTIRKEDAGHSYVNTEIGKINVSDVLGTVLKEDVGKRLYRVKSHAQWPGAPVQYIWQVENRAQFLKRTEGH